MPEEHIKSSLIKDPFDPATTSPDPSAARGRPIISTGTVSNAANGLSGSSYHLMDLPSKCLVHFDSWFKVDGWGYAQVQIGTKDDPDALVDQTTATEAMVTPIEPGDANHGKMLWEVLGLAKDPGGMISLYAHAAADAAGAGVLPFQITYLTS